VPETDLATLSAFEPMPFTWRCSDSPNRSSAAAKPVSVPIRPKLSSARPRWLERGLPKVALEPAR